MGTGEGEPLDRHHWRTHVLTREWIPATRILIMTATNMTATTRNQFNRKPDPTPDEIAEGCRQIQEGWSEQIREQRLAGDDERDHSWTLPQCKLGFQRHTKTLG